MNRSSAASEEKEEHLRALLELCLATGVIRKPRKRQFLGVLCELKGCVVLMRFTIKEAE